jgi:hypothetical protein
MRAALKAIIIITGLVLIAMSAVPLFLGARSDTAAGLLRERLEAGFSHAFGSDAELESIRLRPFRNECELRGLTLDNPPPFKAGEALSCGRVLIKLDYRTIFSGTPVIDRIVLEETRAEIRYRPGEGTNLGTLAKQASALAEALEASGKTRRWRVRAFEVQGAKVYLPGVPVPFNVAPFTVRELESGEPVSAAKLAAVALKSLIMETLTLKGLLSPAANLLRDEIR